MRPRRLVAEGFTAFRERVDINFDDTDFFALVGPTGSGKSSVLDAMCFALYGSVPRYDDDRLVTPAITQGAREAIVSLTFEVEGVEYTATRVAKRAGAPTARLERGDDVLAGTVREMRAAVEALIGLPFKHFRQCVILPQGEFDAFLHDTPAARQDLIVKLLDLGVYETMRRAAAERAQRINRAIEVDEATLGGLAGCTPQAEAYHRALGVRLHALLAGLASADAEVTELARAADEATAEAKDADAVVAALSRVKVPADVRTQAKTRAKLEAERASAKEESEHATSALEDAADALEQLPDPVDLRQLLDAYDQLAANTAHLKELGAADEKRTPRIAAAQSALDDAQHAREHAEQEYEAARDAGAVTSLAAALVVGEPCPVCDQVVQRKPKVRAGDQARAQQQRDGARVKERKAQEALDRLMSEQQAAEASRKTLERSAAPLRKRLDGAPDADAVAKELASVDEARAAHSALQRHANDAVKREREANDQLEQLATRMNRARQACADQRDPLLRANLDVPQIGDDLVASWEALEAWAKAETPKCRARERELRERAGKHAQAARKKTEALIETVADAGVEVPRRAAATIQDLRDLVVAAEQRAKTEADRIAEGIKTSARITTRIGAQRDEADVADELARLLKANAFEKWLVNEALESLVEGASGTLEQLSSGQYALAVNEGNEFEVIDHRNADEPRPAKTLSGGETFQASLALALALADQVGAMAAGGAAKLEAIFLDEGFGTLDPDSLDTVAGTLEALRGDGRMVGIVTHVRDLAERVPVRYEVTKGLRTSTVTRTDS